LMNRAGRAVHCGPSRPLKKILRGFLWKCRKNINGATAF
jgi:hypothetical protein